MIKYYQKKGYYIKNQELANLIRLRANTEDKKLEEQLNGLYKQIICGMRKELDIKNAIALNTTKEITDKVYIIIYDYELPMTDWNCWCTQKYDEEKNLYYIEVDEVN